LFDYRSASNLYSAEWEDRSLKQADLDQLCGAIVSELILGMVRNWEAWRAGRQLPLRKDIDPVALNRALSQIWLVDCSDLNNIIHQVVGEGIRAGYDDPMMGRTVREVHDPETANYLHQMARLIAAKKCAVYGLSGNKLVDNVRWDVERIALPFASAEGGPVTHILGGSVSVENDRASVIFRTDLSGQFDQGGETIYIPDTSNG
jgi:hypothetical protein